MTTTRRDDCENEEAQFIVDVTKKRNQEELLFNSFCRLEYPPGLLQCKWCLRFMNPKHAHNHLSDYHRFKFTDMEYDEALKIVRQANADFDAMMREEEGGA